MSADSFEDDGGEGAQSSDEEDVSEDSDAGKDAAENVRESEESGDESDTEEAEYKPASLDELFAPVHQVPSA